MAVTPKKKNNFCEKFTTRSGLNNRNYYFLDAFVASCLSFVCIFMLNYGILLLIRHTYKYMYIYLLYIWQLMPLNTLSAICRVLLFCTFAVLFLLVLILIRLCLAFRRRCWFNYYNFFCCVPVLPALETS